MSMKSTLWNLINKWRDATTTEAAWLARDLIDVELDQVEALTAERDALQEALKNTFSIEAELRTDRDSLRAELDQLKKQEPVAKYIGCCCDGDLVQLYDDIKRGCDLYLAAGAQPAEIEALRADAERYRKAKELGWMEPGFDATIDAAIKASS